MCTVPGTFAFISASVERARQTLQKRFCGPSRVSLRQFIWNNVFFQPLEMKKQVTVSSLSRWINRIRNVTHLYYTINRVHSAAFTVNETCVHLSWWCFKIPARPLNSWDISNSSSLRWLLSYPRTRRRKFSIQGGETLPGTHTKWKVTVQSVKETYLICRGRWIPKTVSSRDFLSSTASPHETYNT